MKKLLTIALFSLIAFSGFASPSDSIATKDLSYIQHIENWYEENMNYYTITLLMVIESSFIPFPSEVVIPPAAYVASKEGSDLNIWLVILFGTIGALIGAYVNYFLALWLGRPLLHKLADSKFGKMMLLSSEKVQKAEDYFQTHGKTSTFVGRLLPGIRQLISIPAGLARMNLLTFSFFTALGAGIWNGILALLGYIAHGQADLIDTYSHEIGYGLLGIVALIALFYLVKYLRKKKKNQA
jgi:membrane protein DedA with SNARE-associated domain